MSIRAKFKCNMIKKSEDGTACAVRLSAVTTGSTENEQWSKYTPHGDLSLSVSNPAAFNQFEQGKEYYLDISPAE